MHSFEYQYNEKHCKDFYIKNNRIYHTMAQSSYKNVFNEHMQTYLMFSYDKI